MAVAKQWLDPAQPKVKPSFAFRPPVPAYKHSAAQFLKLRGWISSDTPHPASHHRPDSDLTVLQDIVQRLSKFEEA